MDYYSFLIMIGALLALAFIGIGAVIGDAMDKGKLDRDSDLRVRDNRIPDDSVGLDRPDPPTPEEIRLVLYNVRIGASQFEKRIIDYLIDKEGDENNEE